MCANWKQIALNKLSALKHFRYECFSHISEVTHTYIRIIYVYGEKECQLHNLCITLIPLNVIFVVGMLKARLTAKKRGKLCFFNCKRFSQTDGLKKL